MKKLYAGTSRIAGRGIFAGEDIKEGEFVTPMAGKVIRKVYRTKSDLRIGKTWVPIGRNLWMAPGFPIKFMNHSCDANLGFKTPRRVYAIRDIKKGEELTIDYSTVEYVIFWKMRCHCGSSKCRHWMTSIQLLPPGVYKRYLPYIPGYFRKIYLDYRHGKQAG
jgi:hypothetical protein